MYYKILPGSKLYDEMRNLESKMKSANLACKEWVENKFGEGVKFASLSFSLAGGLAAVELKEKPEGYKVVGKPWQKLYAPYARNKKVCKEWDKLPVVKQKELKDLLSYGNYSGAKNGGFAMNQIPAVFFKKDVILVQASDLAKSYMPVDGMIEILASEHYSIVDQSKAA